MTFTDPTPHRGCRMFALIRDARAARRLAREEAWLARAETLDGEQEHR